MFDYWTKTLWQGNQVIIATAGLDTRPLYIKAGSIIPRFPVQNYTGEQEIAELTLDIYPGAGEYFHYQDDGASFAYREGQYNLYQFTLGQTEAITLRIATVHAGYTQKYRTFRIIVNQATPRTILVNGRPVAFQSQDNRTEFVVPATDSVVNIAWIALKFGHNISIVVDVPSNCGRYYCPNDQHRP